MRLIGENQNTGAVTEYQSNICISLSTLYLSLISHLKSEKCAQMMTIHGNYTIDGATWNPGIVYRYPNRVIPVPEQVVLYSSKAKIEIDSRQSSKCSDSLPGTHTWDEILKTHKSRG